MLLDNKVCVIYGAGGSIGGAIARGFAREGARVFLAGRTQSKLDQVADEIRAKGGRADYGLLDALDAKQVNAYVDSVMEAAGQIDVSVNVIGIGDVQQPLMDISLEDFLQPIQNAMRTQFLTTKAAARHMIPPQKWRYSAIWRWWTPNPAGIRRLQDCAGCDGGAAAAVVVGTRRAWCPCRDPQDRWHCASPCRLICPNDSASLINCFRLTLLKRSATLADVGNVAAFLDSDLAQTITATEVNISCGTIVD